MLKVARAVCGQALPGSQPLSRYIMGNVLGTLLGKLIGTLSEFFPNPFVWQQDVTLKKLDGVGPVDNRPSTD